MSSANPVLSHVLLDDDNMTLTNVTIPSAAHTRSQLPYDVDKLKLANRVILIILVVLIMLSMGCVVEWEDMWKKIKKPVGIGIGLLCQFVINPLLAFALAHALDLSTPHAIGVLVIATSPGGTTSNIFTYWSNGDVSLSICMTTASTVAAFGMMPLNLYLYSRSWTDEKSVIPYEKIAIALVSTAVPVAVGMLIRWKYEKIANYITKIGSMAGFLAIIATWILQSLIAPHIFLTSWRIYFASMALPWIGFISGYVVATVFRMTPIHRRTVSLETGCQNVGLCLTLIAISYSSEGEYILFPLLYGMTIIFNSFLFVAIYKVYIRTCGKSILPDDHAAANTSDSKKDALSFSEKAKSNAEVVSDHEGRAELKSVNSIYKV